MTVAEKTQAAFFDAPGSPLRLESVETPIPVEGEVLVRVEHATVCGSDVHTFLGRREEPTPTVLGHEAIGTVEAVGSEPPQKMCGDVVRVGDRITWSVASSCGQCPRCTGGLPQKCLELLKYGHCRAEGRQVLSGGFAQHILLQPGTAIVDIGALPWRLATPLNCATATICATLSEHTELRDRRILILGAGMLGITAAAICRERGADHIAMVDQNPNRLETALRFGVSETVCHNRQDLDSTEGRSTDLFQSHHTFDVILELTGSSQLLQKAILNAAIGGSIILAGAVAPAAPILLDPQGFVRKCLRMRGVHNYTPQDLVAAVEFMHSSGDKYPFASLVGSCYPLHSLELAMDEAKTGRAMRVAIEPWSDL